MTKTIELINKSMRNFKYVNTRPETHKETWKWTDVYFGYREEEFCPSEYCSCDVEYARHEWNEHARTLCERNLRRGENILSLRFERDTKEIDGDSFSHLSDAYNFSYIKDRGFINTFTNRTLQSVLKLSEEDNLAICEAFEGEEYVKEILVEQKVVQG